MTKRKIKAILLVAGEGTRLRPYTNDRPKCLVKVDGETLLESHVNVLKKRGIDEIVLIGGYKIEMLQTFGLKIIENSRFFETNMVWTLFCAANELQGDLIIAYGDIVYSPNILDSLMESDSDISVTVDLQWESYWRMRNENPLDDAETLKLNPDGAIIELGKKPNSINEIEAQYMGLMKFTAKGINQLKSVYNDLADKENSYMTDLLQSAIDKGIRVQSVPISGEWFEVDTVEDLNSDITKSRMNLIMNQCL
jgi:L-glutamine-phosphate cytidylyltransferase